MKTWESFVTLVHVGFKKKSSGLALQRDLEKQTAMMCGAGSLRKQ